MSTPYFVEARLQQVRQRMLERNLNGLLVYFSGQHYMLRFNPFLYLTDFKAMGEAFLYVPISGALQIVATPKWDLARAKSSLSLGEAQAVSPQGLSIWAETLASGFKGRLGIAGRKYVTATIAASCPSLMQPTLVQADDLVADCAASRDEVALACVERAAAIADLGFQALVANAKVGIREYELSAEIEYAMQCAGSEDNYGLISTGAHNQSVRAPTERRLEAGDVVIGEITPCFQGCFAQLCRTFILGEPTELQRTKYNMLLEAHAAALAAACPGGSSRDIAVAVNGVIAGQGYGEYCKPPYMRTRGHGLGFGGVVPADLSERSDVELAEGMTMVIHPNQYIPEVGYFMLGDTVVIESQGARSLTQTVQDLWWRRP